MADTNNLDNNTLDNMPEERQLPVYIFTGFLEAGKTKFIQETLEDKRFNRGERTLLLVCEEGELEIDLKRLRRRGSNIFVEIVPDESALRLLYLSRLEDTYDIQQVMVEYNGMWMLDTLFNAMPRHWVVYQEFMFAQANTFISYNNNMRSLTYDKLRSCELVVINRCLRDIDKMEFHQIIRQANRSCSIAYEYTDGGIEYDDIIDPLPFDIDADIVRIEDRDYAYWYRDLGEEMDKYNGKTVSFKGQVHLLSEELLQQCEPGSFLIGRRMMNCCAADIAFAGLVMENCMRQDLADGDWVRTRAKIEVRPHPAYNGKGPVLVVQEVNDASAPEEELATFF